MFPFSVIMNDYNVTISCDPLFNNVFNQMFGRDYEPHYLNNLMTSIISCRQFIEDTRFRPMNQSSIPWIEMTIVSILTMFFNHQPDVSSDFESVLARIR